MCRRESNRKQAITLSGTHMKQAMAEHERGEWKLSFSLRAQQRLLNKGPGQGVAELLQAVAERANGLACNRRSCKDC